MEKIINETEIDRFLPRCNQILDVRSPAEFEEDHMPGAQNVPVLDNKQRHEIGLMYRQNPFEARKTGARYALLAVERFLGTPAIMEARNNTPIMVYCARGGQRSGVMSIILSQVGFVMFRLAKGYKTYRSYVAAHLEYPLPKPVYVLNGYTGSQKTRLLGALGARVNVLDLEACARHRGSLLGDLAHPQPTQRL